MNNIFFTSDLHWNHDGILSSGHYHENRRNFKDIPEMNQQLIDNINSIVGEYDVLYNLGDTTSNDVESIWNLRRQLKVKTIHYVYGNHDERYKVNRILPNCHYEGIAKEGVVSLILTDGSNPYLNEKNGERYNVCAHDLFTSIQDVIYVKLGGHRFFISHYPHLSWYGSNRGVIMLHGHEHGGVNHLNNDCKRLDVGIDSAKKILGEYRPFSLEEVISLTETKPRLKLGHHK